MDPLAVKRIKDSGLLSDPKINTKKTRSKNQTPDFLTEKMSQQA
jgi:hypothetical protein